jgi:pyrrolidone-carboxylate peptidase
MQHALFYKKKKETYEENSSTRMHCGYVEIPLIEHCAVAEQRGDMCMSLHNHAPGNY